ncbi:response regulator transcription factor [Chelatococcus sambhunathii]|uniref:Response regulator transcription factor n=1 Tax=Chelatococcus sambhunathii TaxID=363953 RepID=A0ABU1DKE0_9HYPH|nr:response regulator transcription factor [Chelatococcus sambhunathii]MDR4308597.1 response regulator transcription factor [Chelatococcus sambhunathii]
MRALLIEDDPMIGPSLKRGLGDAGVTVDWAEDGASGLAALDTASYAVILLDLGLPDGDGLELLDRLRRREDGTPIVILTARDDVESRVDGLDRGADDFLVKPFDLDELKARIRAAVRRSGGRASALVECGELTLDPATREVSYRGARHALSAREFALIQVLAERPGAILSRSQIEDRIYGWGEEVESNAVDVLIHYVRRKFDKDIVRNVRGVGWVIPKTPARPD